MAVFPEPECVVNFPILLICAQNQLLCMTVVFLYFSKHTAKFIYSIVIVHHLISDVFSSEGALYV